MDMKPVDTIACFSYSEKSNNVNNKAVEKKSVVNYIAYIITQVFK